MGLFTSVESTRASLPAEILANLKIADNNIKTQGMAYINSHRAALKDFMSRGWYSKSFIKNLLESGGHEVPAEFGGVNIGQIASTATSTAQQVAQAAQSIDAVKDFYTGGTKPASGQPASVQPAAMQEALKTESKFKTPLIIGGVVLGLGAIGFFVYKMIKK